MTPQFTPAHLQPFCYPSAADLAPADIHDYEDDVPFLADVFEDLDRTRWN